MAKDTSLYLRRAVLTALKAAAAADPGPLVAGSIYPPQRPAGVAWPFLAYGVDDTAAFKASGMDGAAVSFALHAYAATTGAGGATVGGEQLAKEIAGWAAGVLDEAVMDLTDHGCPFPATATATWLATQTIQDGADADAFHSIISMSVTVSS